MFGSVQFLSIMRMKLYVVVSKIKLNAHGIFAQTLNPDIHVTLKIALNIIVKIV